MTGRESNIVFFALPDIIKEGIGSIIKELQETVRIHSFADINLLNEASKELDFALILFDASILTTSFRLLNNLKKENYNVSLIAVQYQFVNQSLLNYCDKIITIDQPDHEILNIIELALRKFNIEHVTKSESLSEREIEVLKLLVMGLSGKEIADKLNISINTVITHRKNISQKTSIKSIAGLTIYAVTNKIISMSNL